MTESQKNEIVRHLKNAKGDDRYRAQRAFSGLTPQLMDTEYGSSGKTCRQILSEYEAHDAEIDELVRAVLNVPASK